MAATSFASVVYPSGETTLEILSAIASETTATILSAGIYAIDIAADIIATGDRAYPSLEVYSSAAVIGTDAPLAIIPTVYIREDETDVRRIVGSAHLRIVSDDTVVKFNFIQTGYSDLDIPSYTVNAGATITFNRLGTRGDIGPESEFVPDLYEDYPTALTTNLGGADRIPIADTGIVGEPNRHVRIGILQEYFADLGNRILIEEATFEDTDKFFFHDDSASAMRYIEKSDLESALSVGNGGTGTTYTGGQGIAISGTEIELSDDGVISEKIADDAILTAHITDVNITRAKIALDAIDGTLIADDAIANVHLGNAVVQSSNIGAAQIITSLLAANSVTTGKVGTGAVTEPKIGADAVTQAKIADDAVQIEHLNANTEISEDNITDGTSNVIGTITGRRVDLAINVLAPETQHYHIFVTRTLDAGGEGTTLSSSSHMIFYVFSGTEWDIEMFQHTDLPTNYLDHLQPGTDIRLVSGDTEWLGQITETLEASTSGAIFRINFSEQQTGSFATDDSIRISFGYAPAAITLVSDGETLLGGGTLRNKFRINIDAPTSANDAQVMAWSDSDSEFVWTANAGGNGASYTQGTGIDITGSVISIADDGVDTDQIAAEAIETEQVNDDAVTLAKLSHGTANMYVGYDASGVPAELGAPVVDLYEDFPTEISTTLVAQDRMVIADVGTTDQPNRHVRLDDLGGYFADLRDRIPTGRAAVDANDRIFFSVESLSGDPMRYASAETLSNYILDLNTHFATEETTIADTDKFFFYDISASAMRYIEKSDLESELSVSVAAATSVGIWWGQTNDATPIQQTDRFPVGVELTANFNNGGLLAWSGGTADETFGGGLTATFANHDEVSDSDRTSVDIPNGLIQPGAGTYHIRAVMATDISNDENAAISIIKVQSGTDDALITQRPGDSLGGSGTGLHSSIETVFDVKAEYITLSATDYVYVRITSISGQTFLGVGYIQFEEI